jgi:hypothetical protein
MKVISVSLITRHLLEVSAVLRRMLRGRKTALPEPLPALQVIAPTRAPAKAAYRANSAAHRLSSTPPAMRRSPAMH